MIKKTYGSPPHISVPDIPHPTLCWKQEIIHNVIQTFERCTYPKGHSGPHQWEANRIAISKR